MNKYLTYLKENLNGKFTWSGYIDQGNHDHKFGPNKFDYICQMPIIGVFGWCFCYLLIMAIACIVRPIQWFGILKEKYDEKKLKSEKQSSCESIKNTSI